MSMVRVEPFLSFSPSLSAVLRFVFAASQNRPHPHHGRKRPVFVFADRAALAALYNATGGANWLAAFRMARRHDK